MASGQVRTNAGLTRGGWQMIFNTLVENVDMEWVMMDSTIVRAHQHAAGAKKGNQNQALGRSCGGFSTKIHAACDALGNPIRFILTGGEASDYSKLSLNERKAKIVLTSLMQRLNFSHIS
jgi:transposase